MKILTILSAILLSSCNVANKIHSNPIANFEAEKYMGQWYEIARTDNRFEKGCTNVTANYSKRKDGGLNVVNKCLVNGKEKIAKGKAYFKKSENIAALKVTFFWPFYGDYNVIYLDENYQYSVVDGGTTEYFWILSRQKYLDTKTLKLLQKKIKENGVDPKALIYTEHKK